MANSNARPDRPRWLRVLNAFRQVHRWAGLGLAMFVTMFAATALWLVHKGQLDAIGKVRLPFGSQAAEPARIALSPDGAAFAALSADGVLVRATGGTWERLAAAPPIDKIDALARGGDAVYLGHARGLLSCTRERGCEEIGRGLPEAEPGRRPVKSVAVDAAGRVVAYVERVGVFVRSDPPGRWTRVAEVPHGAPTPGMELRKLMKDLHTGALFGDRLWALYDLTSLALIFFAISGVYLYAAPELWRRRKAARADLGAPARPVEPSPEAEGA